MGDPLEIPAILLPGLQHRHPLALVACSHADLPHSGLAPLRQRRQRRHRLSLQHGFGLLEDPGISEAAPADHGHVRSGVEQNPLRVLWLPDVAVGDDGDGHSLLHRPDAVPVGGPAIDLRPGAAMDRYSGRSRLLQSLSKLHTVAVTQIPAPAELGRDRHAGQGLHHRLHDASRQLRVLHQCRAVTVVDDLTHGTAHVDI